LKNGSPGPPEIKVGGLGPCGPPVPPLMCPNEEEIRIFLRQCDFQSFCGDLLALDFLKDLQITAKSEKQIPK